MSLVRGCPGHFPRRLGLFVDSYQIKIPHKFGACRRASCPIQPIGGCSCLAHPPVGEVVSPPPPTSAFFLGVVVQSLDPPQAQFDNAGRETHQDMQAEEESGVERSADGMVEECPPPLVSWGGSG